jgi:diguanylate cyclase (GGDEF)-like protein
METMAAHDLLHPKTALAAVTMTSGLVSGAVFLAGGDLRGPATVALAVCLVSAAAGLHLAERSLVRCEMRLEGLRAERDAAYRASLTDALTGLGNRRQFDERLGERVVAASRFGEPFSVAVFDLDDFKTVNDRNGHAAGDAVLRHVAAVLRASTRECDVVCRWGGEEFAVLLPRTQPADAVHMAERILRGLRATTYDLTSGRMPVTASAGVAAFPIDALDAWSVVEAADAALLRAKLLGKDRVERAWSSGGVAVLDSTDGDRAAAAAPPPRVRA